MKKFFVFLCVVLMAITAHAEAIAEVPLKTIIGINPSGTRMDLDGDGQPDEITLTETITDASETYHLTVNGETLSGDGWGLNGKLYAMRLGEADRTYLLVSEDGPSDDPCNYVYRYKEGALVYCGSFGAWAGSVTMTDEGFSATVRGRVIQTWFRRADFIITDNGFFDETTGNYASAAPYLVEVPRDIYAMGTVVTLKQDVRLQVSRQNAETALEIMAGEQAVIVATDDLEWLYLEVINPENASLYRAGWLHLASAWDVDMDGEAVPASDVFSGLLYAD